MLAERERIQEQKELAKKASVQAALAEAGKVAAEQEAKRNLETAQKDAQAADARR